MEGVFSDRVKSQVPQMLHPTKRTEIKSACGGSKQRSISVAGSQPNGDVQIISLQKSSSCLIIFNKSQVTNERLLMIPSISP